jgi:peptidyl-prolyl cis-trans isomerase A (cyclophilin A)
MARTNMPNSATAQFYINVVDNQSLDGSDGRPGYAVFGKVVAGMKAVDEIRNVPTANKGRMGDVPVEPVLINQVRRITPEEAKAAIDRDGKP